MTHILKFTSGNFTIAINAAIAISAPHQNQPDRHEYADKAYCQQFAFFHKTSLKINNEK
jgi:hypothetical protein